MNIIQKPKYRLVPAYSDIVFAVEDTVIISTKANVKYIAEVSISNQTITSSDLIGTFKVTPNNAGVGIFDFSKVVESYVGSDNLGGIVGSSNPSNASEFKGTLFTDETPHSIHIIDKFATNKNSVRFLEITFKIQYSDTLGGDVSVDQTISATTDVFYIYNGTLQEEDIIALDSSGNYGYNLDANNYIMNDTDAKFLTNCPTTINIGTNDYHTLAFFNNYSSTDFKVGKTTADDKIQDVVIKFFDNINGTGTQLSTITRTNNPASGGKGVSTNDSNSRLLFVGCGTANIKNIGTLNASAKSYTVKCRDSNSATISQTYIFNIIDNDCKGFEKIRLTWLNRLGAWDYYSFTKRSVRSVETNRTSYKQLSGTWNERKYKIHGFKGGQKTFKTMSKERIILNSDYVTESESTWLEELFTSPEVYILNKFSTDGSEGYINKYVQPVNIMSSSYIKQTKANDRLLQYTIQIERSKNRVIQNA
jgi:hypothetical protein